MKNFMNLIDLINLFMNTQSHKRIKRAIRHKRVRSVVSGTAARPRLAVFRSNLHIYGQLIDDEAGKTLVTASSREVKTKHKKSELALQTGKLLAGKALEKKLKSVSFDRGGFAYHGRIKAFADGAREGGLEF